MFEIYPANNVANGLQNLVCSFLKNNSGRYKFEKNVHYDKELEEMKKI